MENHYKLLFHSDAGFEGGVIESLWAEKTGDNAYRIDSIPFYVTSVALGDVFSAEEKNGELWGDELLEESGNSTIQVLFSDVNEVKPTGNMLYEKFGIEWEGSNLETLVAFNVPAETDYRKVRLLLDEGWEKWDFREACLSGRHQISVRNG